MGLTRFDADRSENARDHGRNAVGGGFIIRGGLRRMPRYGMPAMASACDRQRLLCRRMRARLAAWPAQRRHRRHGRILLRTCFDSDGLDCDCARVRHDFHSRAANRPCGTRPHRGSHRDSVTALLFILETISLHDVDAALYRPAAGLLVIGWLWLLLGGATIVGALREVRRTGVKSR